MNDIPDWQLVMLLIIGLGSILSELHTRLVSNGIALKDLTNPNPSPVPKVGGGYVKNPVQSVITLQATTFPRNVDAERIVAKRLVKLRDDKLKESLGLLPTDTNRDETT